jgi:hypothetical protein
VTEARKNQGNPPQPAPQPVWSEVARRLADRFHDLVRKPQNLLITPGDNGQFLHEIKKQFQNISTEYLSNTLSETARFEALAGPLPLGLDPAQAVEAALPFLNPDSPLLLATLGGGSFAEIKGGQGLPDVREVGDAMQRLGLSLPVIDRDLLTLTFASPAAAQRTFAAHNWAAPAADDFNISKLTIEIIYIHAHTFGAGQPHAAKRGSGKVPLVKILHDNSKG